MDAQNLGYALTQVVHNLGAVSVTGGAAAARGLKFAEPQAAQRPLAGLGLGGWAAPPAPGAAPPHAARRCAEPQAAQRPLAGLVLGGWVAQGVSGACFGAISYAGYGRLPDIPRRPLRRV